MESDLFNHKTCNIIWHNIKDKVSLGIYEQLYNKINIFNNPFTLLGALNYELVKNDLYIVCPLSCIDMGNDKSAEYYKKRIGNDDDMVDYWTSIYSQNLIQYYTRRANLLLLGIIRSIDILEDVNTCEENIFQISTNKKEWYLYNEDENFTAHSKLIKERIITLLLMTVETKIYNKVGKDPLRIIKKFLI
jgi:hypothetical protein